jgi:hypothetical protein
MATAATTFPSPSSIGAALTSRQTQRASGRTQSSRTAVTFSPFVARISGQASRSIGRAAVPQTGIQPNLQVG